MTTGVLRPLGFGEILDAAIKIVRRRFKHLMLATLVATGPVLLLGAIIQFSANADPNKLVIKPTNPGDPPTFDMAAIKVYGAATIVSTILALIGGRIATGATIKIASGAYLGEQPDWRASLRFAFSRVGPLLFLTLLSTLAVLAGLVLCVIPGIYLSVAFALDVPVLFLEDKSATQALSRSRQLVEGHWWRTLGLLIVSSLLAGVVAGILSAIFTIPAALIDSTFVAFLLRAIGTLVATLITTPISAAIALVMYMDLRVRKEGYDLERMAQQLGVGLPPGGFADSGMPGTGPDPHVWNYPGGYPPPAYPPPGYPPPSYAPPSYAPPSYPPPGYAPVGGAPWDNPQPAAPQAQPDPGAAQPEPTSWPVGKPVEPERRPEPPAGPLWWQNPPPAAPAPPIPSAPPPPPSPSPSEAPWLRPPTDDQPPAGS